MMPATLALGATRWRSTRRTSFHRYSAVLALASVGALAAGCGDAGTAPPNPSEVAAITLDVPTPIMVAGRSDTARATLVDQAEDTLAGLTPTWSVDNPAVLTVDQHGVVTATGAGSATITASINNHAASLTITVAPAAIPFLHRPFDQPLTGKFVLVNPVDHDIPLEFVDDNGIQIDWTGAVGRFLDGHSGFDWALPLGTPVLAAADGRVNFAGTETPFSCPLLGGDTVAAEIVNVVVQAPTGELFATEYVHLSRIDVQKGDSVTAGEQLGLSGSTGCSTGPHLHFQVIRERFTRSGTRAGVTTDPFGWIGSEDDPWLLAPDGAASSNLWLPGERPPGLRGEASLELPLDARGAFSAMHLSESDAAPRAPTSRVLDVEHTAPSLSLSGVVGGDTRKRNTPGDPSGFQGRSPTRRNVKPRGFVP